MLDCFSNSLTSLDVSNNTALTVLDCFNNSLTSLDVRNGANTTINNFNTTGNPNLNCISVDDDAYSTTAWTNIDGQSYFSTDCTPVYTWTGSTDTDWSTSSNWSSNTIPTAADEISISDVSGASGNFPLITPSVILGDITVDVGASLIVYTGVVLDGTFTNNGTVILKDGAFLDDFTNAGSSFVGNIIIETLAANGVTTDQRFISSPVNTPNVSEIGDDLAGPWGTGLPGANNVAITMDDCALSTLLPTSNYGNLFEINETIITTCEKDAWVVRSSGVLENARGYSAYLPNGAIFDFEGTPNTGAQTIATTNSGSGISLGEGWNLIGNPYPSPIFRNDVISAGAADAQYFVTTGLYQGTYSAYLPNSNIAISQGFQVHVNTNTLLSFDNSFRNTNPATWYENENWFEHKLEIAVSGNNGADKTIVFFNQDATNSYEAMYDVTKFESSIGIPTLSTTNGTKQLGLNGMSVNDLGETIPMNLKAGTNGNFSLSFEGKETFPINTTIYVKDLRLNIVHNIADGDYSFSANTADVSERFEIIFIPALSFHTIAIGCENEEGIISLNTNQGLENRTYEIIENGNSLSINDLNNFSFTTNSPANYEIVVNDVYGGIQTYVIDVTALETVISEFTLPTAVFVNEIFSLASLVSNTSNLEWLIENNTILDVTQLTYSFEAAGIYEISLTAQTTDCSDTKTKTIIVNEKTTGIKDVVTNAISVYPNPVSKFLYVEGKNVSTIEVYTILGKKLLVTTEKKIDMKSFEAGIYMMKVFNTQQQLVSINKILKD